MIGLRLVVVKGNIGWLPKMFDVVQFQCYSRNLVFLDQDHVIIANTTELAMPFVCEDFVSKGPDTKEMLINICNSYHAKGYVFFAHKGKDMLPYQEQIEITAYDEGFSYKTPGVST